MRKFLIFALFLALLAGCSSVQETVDDFEEFDSFKDSPFLEDLESAINSAFLETGIKYVMETDSDDGKSVSVALGSPFHESSYFDACRSITETVAEKAEAHGVTVKNISIALYDENDEPLYTWKTNDGYNGFLLDFSSDAGMQSATLDELGRETSSEETPEVTQAPLSAPEPTDNTTEQTPTPEPIPTPTVLSASCKNLSFECSSGREIEELSEGGMLIKFEEVSASLQMIPSDISALETSGKDLMVLLQQETYIDLFDSRSSETSGEVTVAGRPAQSSSFIGTIDGTSYALLIMSFRDEEYCYTLFFLCDISLPNLSDYLQEVADIIDTMEF